ncbi:AAA family ATPase [archaeon 13_1_40CM_4_53_4]|nr:MAG: AAA family ATPase [archaeon 13_1_40CM_4_53_4]OLE58704.1 MAG: AAA family ATPase [Crenarchaeota archaeon 13_1_20CM_2_53_14]
MNRLPEKTATLRVADALQRDVGRGIARIDPKVVQDLGLTSGDVVQITGKRKTNALCWPAHEQDYGKGIVRIDGYLRNNAGVSIDDKVTIRKIDAKIAERLTLAPTEPLRIVGGEEYLSQLLEGRVLSRGDFVPINIMGRTVNLVVTNTTPSAEAVIVTEGTEVLVGEQVKEPIRAIPRISYEDIGGLRPVIQKIREMIELPLRHPELFERLGVEAPKGVLLHGPPGTGKTLLARAVASETNANFLSIGGPEIMSKYYGESEERLREVFKEAQENAPSIVFIDEIDSIAPKREEVTGEVEKRVTSQLLSLMDGLQSRGKVVVIGATNRPNAIDPALRRPGRFDREIEIGVPDRDGRLEVLEIHTRGMPLAEDVDLKKLADVTHGFVGADLEALAKEAAIRALRRILPEINLEAQSIPGDILNKIIVKMSDFLDALKEVEPSAMREVLVEIPDVSWDQIGGLEDVKEELREAVEWPLKYPDLFAQLNASPPKGLLLYGPPGTGKTLLAKAVAHESESNFISVKGPELLNKFVGESEKAVREVFRKARQASPCIIFFDEIDSVAPVRGSGGGDAHVTERVISQFLTEMDGLEELRNVVIIAATNRPDIIDSALLRPGRFDRLLFVPPPDLEARRQIFKIHTRKTPLGEDVNLDELAKRTDGYTGADIASVANTAVMLSLREHISKSKDPEDAKKRAKGLKVAKRHYDEALQKIKPMSSEELKMYERFSQQFSEAARPKIRVGPSPVA